jgi:hypothetical protein
MLSCWLAAQSAYGAALVAGEMEWLGILKGRRVAAEQSDDQPAANYIAAQILVVENEAQSIAKTYQMDSATVSAAALEPVPEDTTPAKAHQATYPTIAAFSLDAFPRSPLDPEGSVNAAGDGRNHDGQEKVSAETAAEVDRGSNASDTDSN